MPLDMDSVAGMKAPRMDPREEHGLELVRRMEASESVITQARQMIEEHDPIVRSCRRALEELHGDAVACAPSPQAEMPRY